MQLITYSYLINCKFRVLSNLSKRLCSGILQFEGDSKKTTESDPSLIEISDTWKETEEIGLRASVLRDMQVYPDFVSEEEEANLLAEVEPYLKRMRYEFDHWDNAIHGFRETERSQWRPENQAVLERVRALAFGPRQERGQPLPHVHVLDLAAAGHIEPHVDALRFCGGVIAGACLASGAVMRLRHSERPHLELLALLPRRCLYLMTGVARYQFSHAVLGGAESRWRGRPVPRARRVALICRSRPDPATPEP